MFHWLAEFIVPLLIAALLGLFLGWLLWRWRRCKVDTNRYNSLLDAEGKYTAEIDQLRVGQGQLQTDLNTAVGAREQVDAQLVAAVGARDTLQADLDASIAQRNTLQTDLDSLRSDQDTTIAGLRSELAAAAAGAAAGAALQSKLDTSQGLSLIHISEPTRRYAISYAVFCLKKKI